MPVAEVGYGRPFRWEMARMLAGKSCLLTNYSITIITIVSQSRSIIHR